jgi:hypothetical protein
MAVPTAYVVAMVMRVSVMVRGVCRRRILLAGGNWGLRPSHIRKAQQQRED